MPARIRPTSARVREALFSIWAGRIPGARFLDLFAGSGAVGLEALSRGAEELIAVESSRTSIAALERNLSLVEPPPRLLREPARKGIATLRREGARFDLLFADPPYDQLLSDAEWRGLFDLAGSRSRLAYEHSAAVEVRAGECWKETDRRRYGDSVLTLLEPATESDERS